MIRLLFRGAWVSGATYSANDCVLYGGDTWKALATVTGTPSLGPNWQLLSVGSYRFVIPAGVTSTEVLVVAGGGGGGAGSGGHGGGAAGGVLYRATYTFTQQELTAGYIDITVGAGGLGGASSSNGGSSIFGSLTATGGGRGGAYNGGSGQSGGSGGGGAGSYGQTAGSGGAGISGQGQQGGSGIQSNWPAGGGGGGATAAGATAVSTTGGAGGSGIDYSSIFGSDVGASGWFSGGGGGGRWESGSVGAGGQGGGGGGGTGSAGLPNTGGGGSGGTVSQASFNGGSGVIILIFTEPVSIRFAAPLVQPWSIRTGDSMLASLLAQSWNILGESTGPAILDQLWGLKLGTDLLQPYADAPVLQSKLFQPWGDAQIIKCDLIQRWRDAVLLRAQLDQPYHLPESLRAFLAQPWALASGQVQGMLAQAWTIRDVEQVLAVLAQPWSINADGSVLRYSVTVLAAGYPVRVSHVNIEADRNQDCLSCEIHPATEAEYLLCADRSQLTVTIESQEGTESFAFVVTSPRITEQHGDTRYIVEAMSPLVLLGEPYANPIEGELTGMASALAADLSGDLALSWQTVDWHIPPATWIASGETPLTLLKQLAAAVGAVVQSAPDGTIIIAPDYPVALPLWSTTTPGLVLVEILDCFTTGSTPEHRLGYNQYLVGNQMSANDSLRLEEEELSATTKEVRGYQVPWDGAFALAHTGGDWVLIEPMGIEERQETETVEFVAGSGRVQYPIYRIDSLAWGQANLGSLTFAEDGALSATIAEESLLTITYTTRCQLWRVKDSRTEKLQLVMEAAA